MDNIFKLAIKQILKDEGGYVNDPKDAGGETNYGISKRSYPHLDIKKLTRDEAINIYYTDWWCKYGFYKIRDDKLRVKVFNISINVGYTQAVKCLQRAVRCASDNAIQLNVDGIMGRNTLDNLNTTLGKEIETYYAFKSEVAGFYRGLNKERFIKGWENRAYDR